MEKDITPEFLKNLLLPSSKDIPNDFLNLNYLQRNLLFILIKSMRENDIYNIFLKDYTYQYKQIDIIKTLIILVKYRGFCKNKYDIYRGFGSFYNFILIFNKNEQLNNVFYDFISMFNDRYMKVINNNEIYFLDDISISYSIDNQIKDIEHSIKFLEKSDKIKYHPNNIYIWFNNMYENMKHNHWFFHSKYRSIWILSQDEHINNEHKQLKNQIYLI